MILNALIVSCFCLFNLLNHCNPSTLTLIVSCSSFINIYQLLEALNAQVVHFVVVVVVAPMAIAHAYQLPVAILLEVAAKLIRIVPPIIVTQRLMLTLVLALTSAASEEL